MANVQALRARLLELVKEAAEKGEATLKANELHARLERHHKGNPPVSRATVYKWFNEAEDPKASILECVPAFAEIFDVEEYEFWRVAEILPPEMDSTLAISSAVHDLRGAYRRVQKALANNGLSTAGEALVIDRVLHHKLDYRMQVWPVVRGRDKPLHLHSWIVLEPIAMTESHQRKDTSWLEMMAPLERRAFLRDTVITESLWRTLGLQWRERMPARYDHLGPHPLFIEVPVEERNRLAPPEPVFPALQFDRVLVLGTPWSHAELMVALLADALHFGSWDLRYLGLPPGRETAERARFCRVKLAEERSRYVWAIAQRSDLTRSIRSHVLAAADAPGRLIVAVTLGERLQEFAADALRTRVGYQLDAAAALRSLAGELEGRCDLVRVHIDDEDVLDAPELGEVLGIDPTTEEWASAVRDRMVDVVRRQTAGVLNVLADHRHGPGLTRWGDRFEDLRLGDEERADAATGRSTVTWLPRATTDRAAG